jgi:hypothetical protein
VKLRRLLSQSDLGERHRHHPKGKNQLFVRSLPTKPRFSFLSPRRPGGEVRVTGANEPVCGGAHLTFPSLRDGPLPLPSEGRRGAKTCICDGARYGRATAILVIVLALAITGCGKRNAPQPPPDVPTTYPRPYPSE